jgi:hypothetical protein
MNTKLHITLAFVLAMTALLWAPGPPEGRIHVRISEKGSGQPLPCRLTIVDQGGELADLTAKPTPGLAIRRGVIYTVSGEAEFGLPPGKYTLYATRGMEYSLARQKLNITSGTTSINLTLEREVDTSGYVAVDTHVHTLTFSGHGDATAEERMVTIAGEGIEAPVSTEHNRHSDYRALAESTGAARWFTPILGNEVTTATGHFNIFPVHPGSAPPDYKLSDWTALLAGIRATPGVRFVVLNHPRDLHSGFIPADPARFHPASGESLDGRDWSMNGIELINSSALRSDFMEPYRDWFALLNRGKQVVGVGSSDCHDVNLYILGQGRTYVRSNATDPSKIGVDELCTNLLAGRAGASLGLFTEMKVDDKATAGDIAWPDTASMNVRIKVQGPRWITADRVEVFQNGQKVASKPIVGTPQAVTKLDTVLTIPRPAHDVWLVAVASGPGVREPYWPLSRPYQPNRPDWDPRVIGSTGPIYVDADGSGRYESPYESAKRLVEQSDSSPAKLIDALSKYDEATAAQAASVCRARGMDLRAGPFQQALQKATPAVRHGFTAYLNLLPKGQ